MLQKLVSQWDARKDLLKSSFEADNPSSYDDIFKRLFEVVLIDDKYDTSKITTIDDGDYQGTRIFIIPEDTYQPSESEYLVCGVSYGSCSGCDTFEAICAESYDDKMNATQIADIMTLALHMLQAIRPLLPE